MGWFEGNKPPVGQDKGTSTEVSFSAFIQKREREGFPGGSYPKLDPGRVVVPKDRVRVR